MRGPLGAAWVAAFLAGANGCLADSAADMANTADGFYRAYLTVHPSDGIPDAGALAKYEPYISPALDRLLKDGAAAEAAFASSHKDSPPVIEGDLFTSNFEGASTFKVGACRAEQKSGHCSVALTYSDTSQNPGDKPFVWNDTVYLIETPEGWRIDDVGYGGNWPFGNKGRLKDTLKQAIAEARG